MSRTYTLRQIANIVRRSAPTLYLHDDEAYMPSSVDWFLQQAEMVARTGERVKLVDGSGTPESKLKSNREWPFTGDSADYWLEVPESVYAGDYTTARSYVSIRTVKPGFLDITHWFWYPANGCGTARLRTLMFDTTVITKEAVPLPTLGFHVSDWEKVTIRVTDDNANTISEVYFSQHGGGHWLKLDQVQFEPSGSLVVYASRNGHASYPDVGEHYTAHIKTAPNGTWAKVTPAALEIWLRNDTMKGTRKVDCVANHEIVSIQDTIPLQTEPENEVIGANVPFFGRGVKLSQGGATMLEEPAWLQYPYRWGPETEQKITHELVFEALKMAIGPLIIYSGLTGFTVLPLLGAMAGLLVPYLVKLETENGKPGPKVKYTSSGVVDQESDPEPDNLFTDAVDGGIGDMVDWCQVAGQDVANWTVGAGETVLDWTTDAGNDVADWTKGAANDTVSWFSHDVADWTKGAANDVADWTKGSANDVADWTKGAANDIADTLNPEKWL